MTLMAPKNPKLPEYWRLTSPREENWFDRTLEILFGGHPEANSFEPDLSPVEESDSEAPSDSPEETIQLEEVEARKLLEILARPLRKNS
jgi:hypothetical protein